MELKTRNKVAFCIGAFGKDVVYMLITSYLLYYYNTVLKMNASFIGTVLMGARVFDAFNDPIMGIVVAKTSYNGHCGGKNQNQMGTFQAMDSCRVCVKCSNMLCPVCNTSGNRHGWKENMAYNILSALGHNLHPYGYTVLVHGTGYNKAGK